MQFEFNEQQRMIRDMARDFAAREIAPIAAAIDEEERFPTEVVKKMGELGFMGMNVPEQYGGAGLDSVHHERRLAHRLGHFLHRLRTAAVERSEQR